MILSESKNSKYFDTSTTGMNNYDDMIIREDYYRIVKNLVFVIKWMKPSNYIRRCADDIFNVTYERLLDHRSDSKISKYSEMMKSGIKFDMPIINYSKHSQEGLHRAIAAMSINEDELIPVMVIYDGVPLHKFTPPLYPDKI